MTNAKSLIIAIVVAFVLAVGCSLILPEKYSVTLPVAIGLGVGWIVRELTRKGIRK